MDREKIAQKYLKLLSDIKSMINNGQTSSEAFMEKIAEYQTLQNEYPLEGGVSDGEFTPDSNIPEWMRELFNGILLNRCPTNDGSIDRQSLSVRIRQINGDKTTIKDEKIRRSNSGGFNSEIEQAIIISCEGKRIEANNAQGICEVTGKLAQRALSCRLCHRSICLRHCEFIEQSGEHYPYCNTPLPKSKVSCVRRVILSMDTWKQIERQERRRGTDELIAR